MKSCEGERKLVKVGNYAMTGRLLGKGHFARVQEATHIHLNVKVAVKVLTLSEIKDEYVIKNMRREARILAKVSHPNIIYLFETITTTKRYYIITELVNGGDLCSHITSQRAGKLDEKSTRALARQIISAVAHLHELGIVHRDLKMENILLDSSKERVKLADFGLSNYRKGGGLLQTHCGSPEYAAPELFVKGRQYGPEVDIWSLGIIFYGMLVGKLPFQSGHKAELSIEAKRKQLIRETKIGLTQRHQMSLMDVSLLFRNLLERMVCPNPEERITMINLQSHAWIYGRFYKEYPQLDCNWVKRALHRIAKMIKLPVAEVCQTIEKKRYSPLAGIYNIAKLREMQRRIEVEDLKSKSKEAKNKRYIHIDLYEGTSKPNRLVKPPETLPLAVAPTLLKVHNPVCQSKKPATVDTDKSHRLYTTPQKSTTSTQKRFATSLGAAISKILHKHKSPSKQLSEHPKSIIQGKDLRKNKESCGFPPHTAARAVARAESDKRKR